MRIFNIGLMAALALAAPIASPVAIVPEASTSPSDVKRKRRQAVAPLSIPRWRRSRSKPLKRKLHANLAHRSKRVRRKHRRAA